MRIALGLEYDGGNFCGWQSQHSGCGIQDHLQSALSEIAAHSVSVAAAGRTDAGVHALIQVAHFDTCVARPSNAWVRGVNAFLPSGIRVLWAKRVSDEFHARFSAERRFYQYVLLNTPVAPAVLSGKVGWYHRPLDLSAMQSAAQHLLGEHDFSAFRSSECQAKSPVKDVDKANVSQQGQFFVFEFGANAFLHHMVRNLVGSLLYVGSGKCSPSWFLELLHSQDRTLAAPTFMPDGLYLAGVRYKRIHQLPDCLRTFSLR